jgi:hypothetical protein
MITEAATHEREREDDGEGDLLDHSSGVTAASGVKSSVA